MSVSNCVRRYLDCDAGIQGHFNAINRGADSAAEYFQGLYKGRSADGIGVIPEGYRCGNLQLVFRLRSLRDYQEWDAVFVAFDIRKVPNAGHIGTDSDQIMPGSCVKSNDGTMFGLFANHVQCPQHVSVPSLVWLEAPKCRDDVRWKGFFKPPLSTDKILPSVGGVGNGEINVRRDGVSDDERCVVQRCPEIGYCVADRTEQGAPNWVIYPDLVNYLTSVRVCLADDRVFIYVKGDAVFLNPGFTIGDMRVCAR